MSDHMKVMNNKNMMNYISAANQTDFEYNFLIFQTDDLSVYINREKVISGYSVLGLGQSSGGTVAFDIAPPEGAHVSLIRQLKIERTSDFQPSGEFRADVLNTELDYLTASVQDVAATAGRSIRLDPTDDDTSVTLTLPVRAERANRWLAFDGQGNVALATAPASGGSVGGGASQWGQITGLLSAQSDLQAALSGKADAVHAHDGSYAPASHVGTGETAHAEVSLTSAGFMSPADKQKLDGIEPSSQANPTGAELIASINGELGSSAWQSGGSGSPAWGSIGGSLAAQSDLQAALDARAAADHGHSIADITGLQSSLDGKSDAGHDHAGLYAPVSHSHDDASTVTSGLLSPGDKQKLDTIEANASADQTGSEIIALVNTELGGTSWQSGGSGTPAWGSISGTLSAQTDLQAALAGKSDTGHDHTGLYAPAAHIHGDASTGTAGFMSPGDKQKLDTIEANASADQTGSEIIALVNTELGGTSWQSGGSGTPSWGFISGTLSAQTDLQAALAGKSDSSHNHNGNYAALSHGHAIADVTGLEAELNGKAASGHDHDADYAAVAHSHAIADVTGLQVELDGKIDDGSLVSSDANNTVTADPKFWSGSQANYDAIGTKDSNTFYFIED